MSLSRVGITDMQRIIRLASDGGCDLFYANLELFVDLNPEQMGVHMSRFSDVLEEVVDEYYQTMGWDPDSGHPTAAKLHELELGWVADELRKRGLAI